MTHQSHTSDYDLIGASPAEVVPDELSPGKVLLVEDDDTDAFIFHRAVHQLGLPSSALHSVASVADAICWLEQQTSAAPRLVVCDLRLREGTSLDLVEWMHKHDDFRNVPVVLWTGTLRPAEAASATKLGVLSMLTKSGDMHELTSWLEGLLRQTTPALTDNIPCSNDNRC